MTVRMLILCCALVLSLPVSAGDDMPRMVPTPDGDAISLGAYSDGATLHLLSAIRPGGDQPGRITIWHQRSEDGGISWSSPVRVDEGMPAPHNPHRSADIRIAGIGDDLVAIWSTGGGGFRGSGKMVTALSDDGGRSWSRGPMPPDDVAQAHGFFEISADAAGHMHLVWLDNRDGAQGLRYARSRDRGRSWSSDMTIDGQTCECCWNAVLPGSSVLSVLYRDKDPRDMRHARLGQDGDWQRTTRVGEFDWQVDACPHTGGALAETSGDNGSELLHALVWTGHQQDEGLYYLRSADQGSGWELPRRFGMRGARNADLVTDRDGDLVAVWDEMANDKLTVYVSRSLDQGDSWSEPMQLSTPGTNAMFPLAVVTDHGVRVLWTGEDAGGRMKTVIAHLP